ncbi:hypothetical protein AB1Y20_017710 [Prymnesium parvum]|uniref:Profilin n=1 Tax=Prymnesium parvum TaxID=97485 RepID=A0AB34JP67_PRYPA
MSAKAQTPWDRHVALLIGTGGLLSGGLIIPIQQSDVDVASRKGTFYAQKGLSAKQPEVTALVDAVMDGKVHKDYVSLGGQQYMITTVTEASFYGRSISTAASGGIVLVKTARFLVVGVYTEPATAAQVVPHVHRFAQELPKLVGPP